MATTLRSALYLARWASPQLQANTKVLIRPALSGYNNHHRLLFNTVNHNHNALLTQRNLFASEASTAAAAAKTKTPKRTISKKKADDDVELFYFSLKSKNNLTQVLELFPKMKELKAKQGSEALSNLYNAVFTAVARAPKFDEASHPTVLRNLLSEMREGDIALNSYNYSVLVGLIATKRKIFGSEMLSEVLKEVEDKDMTSQLSDFAVSQVIQVMAKEGRSESAEKWLQVLMSRESTLPDSYVCNAIIDMWVKKGEIDNAENVFQYMKHHNIPVTVFTCAPLVQYYAKHQMTQKAEETFKLVSPEHAWSYRPFALSMLLSMWIKTKDWSKAAEVVQILEKVVGESQRTPMITNLLLKYYTTVDNAEKVTELVDQMNNPDAYTFPTLISYYAKKDEVDRVDELYQKLRNSSDIPVDNWTYSSMIHMWARKGDATRVNELIEKLQEAGQSLNIYIYNSLLSIYTKSGDTAKAEEVVAEMEKNNMPSNTYTYNYLINMWAAKGDAAKVETLKKQMAELNAPSSLG